MIAFWDNLPLIEHANGHVTAFQRDWLTRSLSKAAAKAGYAHWWLAEHVAMSVTEYLRQQREVNVVPIDRLGLAVKTALQGIGYADVAEVFEPTRPRVEISLVDLAVEAIEDVYELAFFSRLRHVIQELVGQQSFEFDFRGLDKCVRLLVACRSWSRSCEYLRSEIVDFTRTQTVLAAGGKEVSFTLA